MTSHEQAPNNDWQNLDTATASELAPGASPISGGEIPGLTVLCHPDVARVGEQAALTDLHGQGEAQVSRLEPSFRTPGGEERGPLADSRLSRKSLRLVPRPDGGLLLDARALRNPPKVGGVEVEGEREISAAELAGGVTLVLGARVALLLHRLMPSVVRPPAFEMVGESAPMLRLRREIERVADLTFPVLIRGESGAGKELVARAIQRAGPRRTKPFFAVNMAAVPATLAASELFGAAKGAFSGADRRRPGYFERADGGTLFLDEIGEMPVEVQVLLLRALESGEIQPVGAGVPQPVDTRVLAATDADLEGAITSGSFKAPLLHRLASYEIVLPTLRERRDDIARLFFHFLRQELAELGEPDRLAAAADRPPWVSAELVARLVAFDWPGNVRQLRNVVRQLAVASRGSEVMVVGSRVERLLAEGTGREDASSAVPSPSPPARKTRAAPRAYRDTSEISDDELIAALRAHQFRLKPTAAALGISRASLYVRIDACPEIRKASDLGREEIEATRARCDGRVEAMAEELEVSKQGLKMRMKELGLR